MITESEFVMIKGFDRTLQQNTDHAQRIINRKTSQLIALAAEVSRLRTELAAETGKRRMAELQLARTRRH